MSDDQQAVPLWGLGCAAFALGAVGLELVGSAWANSPTPGWTHYLVPLAWPAAARVAWWLLVSGAVAGFHYAQHRVGIRRHPVVVAATVLPFAGFAVGIALGAEFATWH